MLPLQCEFGACLVFNDTPLAEEEEEEEEEDEEEEEGGGGGGRRRTDDNGHDFMYNDTPLAKTMSRYAQERSRDL